MKNKNIYLIIGASAAAIAAAKKIRALDNDAVIICFCAEEQLPYNKCFLVDWLSQTRSYDALFLHTQEFFDAQRIAIKLNTPVMAINREEKYVITADGVRHHYTKLLIATGARARMLPETIFSDVQQPIKEQNIIPFYTLEDAHKVYQAAAHVRVKTIIVIGGGISGVECADALSGLGKKIIVIERAPQVLAHQIAPEHAAVVTDHAQACNVQFLTNTTLMKIIQKPALDGHVQLEVTCCVLADGMQEIRVLQADLIVTTLGSVPNTALASNSNIVVDQSGIKTNAFLQTNDPYIFAAGDCALVVDSVHKNAMRSVMWSDALVQGMVAGTNMVALTREYSGALPITVSHIFGMQLASYRRDLLDSDKYVIEHTKTQDAHYSVAFTQDKVVVGFVCLGPIISYTHLKKSLLTGVPYSPLN